MHTDTDVNKTTNVNVNVNVSDVCVRVLIWPTSIAFETTLQFARLRVYIIYRKVLKPKIGRSLEVESSLTAATPYPTWNRTCKKRTLHVSPHAAHKFNKFIAAFDSGQFTKSETRQPKYCHCDTFCNF